MKKTLLAIALTTGVFVPAANAENTEFVTFSMPIPSIKSAVRKVHDGIDDDSKEEFDKEVNSFRESGCTVIGASAESVDDIITLFAFMLCPKQ